MSSLLDSLYALRKYRHRLSKAVATDVRQRYAGSVLGMLWVFLYPALLLAIYALLYVYIFKVRPGNLDEATYTIFVFSGLVPVLAFNESLFAATTSLTSSRSLLFNTVFPAELIPVRAAMASQVTSLVAIGITVTAAIFLGRAGTGLIWVPVLWLELFMFCTGLGWILSLVTLVAKDVQHLLSLVLMLMMLLSPIAYTPEMVPEGLKIILFANPITPFVLGFQSAICYGTMPSALVLISATVLAGSMFFAGYAFHVRARHIFYDHV